MLPKISIIIPVYNIENYVGACLDSVVNQTFQDYEIIVVDDGSTDQSLKIVREYEEKYKEKIKVISQKNSGQGGARNTGMAAAKGEFFLFIDGDDYITETALEKLVEKQKEQDADVVVFEFAAVDEKGKYLGNMQGWEKRDTKEMVQDPAYYLVHITTTPCKLWRKSLFLEHGILFSKNIWFEDLEITKKVMAHVRKAVSLDEEIYYYVYRQGSTMNNRRLEKNRDLFQVMDHILEYYQSIGKLDEYQEELEFSAVLHILYYGTTRINAAAPFHPLQKEFLAYMNDKFPDFRKNKYLSILYPIQKKQLSYILEKQYLRLYIRYFMIGNLKKMIKKWIKL